MDNIAAAKARRTAALALLPPDLRAVVEQMRGDLDAQSRTLINKGMISAALQVTTLEWENHTISGSAQAER